MNEEIKHENMRIHSRADELIACLEGEIAKRDEVIVGLTNSRDFWREKAIAADDELAAIKAQEQVAYIPVDRKFLEEIADSLDYDVRDVRDKVRSLLAAPVSDAKAQGVVMPEGWIPLTIEHEPGYPEDVAFGPKRMMDRLKKWLDRYFEMRLNAAPVQQVSVPDKFCIGAWRDALEKIAKYAPQVNCAARTELERAGLIAVHALIAFSAPQFRHARGTQTASNAAPAAPAADAGLVEAFCKVEQALDLIGGIRHGKNVTQDELWQSCELLDAALASHRANGVV